MHSLHWILALTLLHYLTAAPTEDIQRTMATNLIQLNIQDLQKANCPTHDATFYSDSSIQAGCIKTALRCASEELKVVAKECWDDDSDPVLLRHFGFGRQTSDVINTLLLQNTTNEAVKCTACENYPKKPYKEFISDLKTLIEKFNTQTASLT